MNALHRPGVQIAFVFFETLVAVFLVEKLARLSIVLRTVEIEIFPYQGHFHHSVHGAHAHETLFGGMTIVTSYWSSPSSPGAKSSSARRAAWPAQWSDRWPALPAAYLFCPFLLHRSSLRSLRRSALLADQQTA